MGIYHGALFGITEYRDELKNISQIEHTRHRSMEGLNINSLSGIISYISKIPSINLGVINRLLDAGKIYFELVVNISCKKLQVSCKKLQVSSNILSLVKKKT